jgi:hypothetical protein
MQAKAAQRTRLEQSSQSILRYWLPEGQRQQNVAQQQCEDDAVHTWTLAQKGAGQRNCQYMLHICACLPRQRTACCTPVQYIVTLVATVQCELLLYNVQMYDDITRPQVQLMRCCCCCWLTFMSGCRCPPVGGKPSELKLKGLNSSVRHEPLQQQVDRQS